MESLPVEIIGNILSILGAARDVMVASTTCRKWRVAARHLLNTLCFNTADWPVYRDLPTEDLEVLITLTIMQTLCLQHLSIKLGNNNEFSAASVIAWLMYTRESLRFLTYMMKTKPCVNILERCGKSKLERLVLGYTCILSVDPSVQRFPTLLSLALSCVIVSSSNLNALLSACPRLEAFSVIDTEINFSNSMTTLKLTSSSLRTFYTEDLIVENVVLEADHLDTLYLRGTQMDTFVLKSQNSLRVLRIEDTTIMDMDIGEATELLEDLYVNNFEMSWSRFFLILSRALKLRKLGLWQLQRGHCT